MRSYRLFLLCSCAASLALLAVKDGDTIFGRFIIVYALTGCGIQLFLDVVKGPPPF